MKNEGEIDESPQMIIKILICGLFTKLHKIYT